MDEPQDSSGPVDDRWTLGGILLVVLAVRLMVWAGTYAIGTDSAAFLRMAELIREGEWHEALRTYYHPGYPAAVALFSHVTGDFERAGFLVSILSGSIAVLPLFLLARDLFGRPAALVTVLLYAAHFTLVELHVDVMTEGLYFAAFFGAIWMGRRFLDSNRLPWAIGAGVLSAGAFLVRHEGLIAVCGLVSWFLFEAIRRKDRSSGALCLGAVFAGGAFLIASMPFLVWVRGEMGQWVTTAKGSGTGLRLLLEGEFVPYGGRLIVKAIDDFAEVLCRFVLLVPLGAGLALAWRQERWRRLYLASWPAAYLLGLLYMMQGVGHVSYRYLTPAFCLLLPFLSWGLLRLLDRIPDRMRPRAVMSAALALGLLVGHQCFNVRRWDDVPLVRAGEWIRAQSAGRPRILTTRDKVAWYARGDLRPAPRSLEDALSCDFVVFAEREFEKPRWPFMPALDRDPRFERVPDDFRRARGQSPVRVYRVRK